MHHREHREHGEKFLNGISERIIGCAIKVHEELGPGLLESAYSACLDYELKQAGLNVEREKVLAVRYRDTQLDCNYRLDLLVEQAVIVEVKCVEKLLPIHDAQLLTYLKLSGLRLGLLMNFNVKLLKQGLRRLIL